MQSTGSSNVEQVLAAQPDLVRAEAVQNSEGGKYVPRALQQQQAVVASYMHCRSRFGHWSKLQTYPSCWPAATAATPYLHPQMLQSLLPLPIKPFLVRLILKMTSLARHSVLC